MTLTLGDHACSVVDSDAARQRTATDFVRDGIRAGDRVCYLSAAPSPAGLCHVLAEHGLPVESALARGQLVVTTADQSYVASRTFAIDDVLAMMHQLIDDALSLGFPGVRISGEMDWAARAGISDDQLVEYERRATEVFTGRPALALCQYDARVATAGVLEQVRRVHPTLVEERPEHGHTVTVTDDDAGLSLTGDLDIDSRHQLAAALDRLGARLDAECAAECHLDLAGVGFIDVAGTMQLVRFAQQHPACRLVVHAAPTCLVQVAQVLWPEQRWELCP
jgi:ABC-type transporter Mla MlaB component